MIERPASSSSSEASDEYNRNHDTAPSSVANVITHSRPSRMPRGSGATPGVKKRVCPCATCSSAIERSLARARALLGRELDVDAAVLLPAGLVGAGRVDRAARGDLQLGLRDAEPHEVLADRVRAPRAEAHVVLLGAARIGAADHQDVLALERAGHQARRELIE